MAIIASEATRRKEQAAEIVRLREVEQLPFHKIGPLVGLTPTRAGQIYGDVRRFEKAPDVEDPNDPYRGLSARAANICYNRDLKTRADILAAITNGSLHPKRKIRNYGWITHYEIHDWLGLQRPTRHKPHLLTCPHCGGKLP